MNEDEIKVFIDGAMRYFERVSGQAATIEPPFLRGNDPLALEFSGVIGISGRHRGAVYFTSGRELLTALLERLGDGQVDDASLADLVGEVANTIAGNARRYFGGEFLISVPIVLTGRPASISFPRDLKSVVIPILWGGARSFLIVCLEHKGEG